ncbi:hypothetical protein [Acidihalobacter prosperus]
MHKSKSLILWSAFLATGLIASNVAEAGVISKHAKAGDVQITLDVLPAEAFKGPHASMVRSGGAMPMLLSHSPQPNHHMVVFIKRSNKPVEKANVTIRYRELSPHKGKWISLPVVRMHVAGKSLATTHFGNNVNLSPGNYEAKVAVNHNAPVNFHFKLEN